MKARQRAKRSEKEKAAKAAARGEDMMETEPTVSTPVTPGPSAVEGDDKMEIEDDGADKKEDGEKKDGEVEKKKRAEKEKVGYEVVNMARVLPEQLKYISFPNEGRYEPVKKVYSLFLIESPNLFTNLFLAYWWSIIAAGSYTR